MKRLWIAAGLLVMLLLASLGNAYYARELTGGMTDRLGEALTLAQAERWEEAEALTRQVYRDWERHHTYFHTTMRHSDTDQVLRAFRAVMEYLAIKEMDQYAAANADLVTQLELLAEMEQPSFVNVF